MVFPQATPVPVSEPWVQTALRQTGISASGSFVNLPRHPSQLYEALGEGLLLWGLLWLLKDRKAFDGYLIGVYLVGYGLARFVIEYFRNPDVGLDFIVAFQPASSTSQLEVPLGDFSMGQLLSALMVVGGLLFLLLRRGRTAGKLRP
jgi:phosphatidylglycerol:prolipoprotein diacylglycerol transferase